MGEAEEIAMRLAWRGLERDRERASDSGSSFLLLSLFCLVVLPCLALPCPRTSPDLALQFEPPRALFQPGVIQIVLMIP